MDYKSLTSGKHFDATKRRVWFQYGFSDNESIAEGHTGNRCQGSEYEVTLIWSMMSGKRLVLADVKEVHFSTGKLTQGKFQLTWTIKSIHVLKIIGHAALPLTSRGPGWKQFDLQIDGLSVLDMPKIFELGMKV